MAWVCSRGGGREQAWLQAGSQAGSRAPQRETPGSSSHTCLLTLVQDTPLAPQPRARSFLGGGRRSQAGGLGPAPAGQHRGFQAHGHPLDCPAFPRASVSASGNWASICAAGFPGAVPPRAVGELEGKCCHGVFRGHRPGLFIAPFPLSFSRRKKQKNKE